jgi:ankyrin repeat protein
MEVKIRIYNEKITIKDLDKFERKNKITFPEDYKKFLLKFNGGYPEPNFYLCGEGFGINTKFKEQKEEVVQIVDFTGLDGSFLASDIVPKNIFTIGEDNAGNYFCISVAGDDKGNIYFCNHGDCDEGPYSNLYLLANRFDDFLNGLQEDPSITVFEKYCEKNDLKSIKKLLDEGLDINTLIIPNHNGYSLLNVAITARKPEIIKYLLEKGANAKSSIWSIYPDQEILDLLLEKGADINERNYDGETPLFRFVGMSQTKTIKLLLERGADVFAKDKKGFNVLEMKLRKLQSYNQTSEEDKETIKLLEVAMQNK